MARADHAEGGQGDQRTGAAEDLASRESHWLFHLLGAHAEGRRDRHELDEAGQGAAFFGQRGVDLVEVGEVVGDALAAERVGVELLLVLGALRLAAVTERVGRIGLDATRGALLTAFLPLAGGARLLRLAGDPPESSTTWAARDVTRET